MGEYVPYEERLRRAEKARQDSEREGLAARRRRVEEVTGQLSSLGGERTNCYLEVLVPARKPRWINLRKTIITKGGLVGGPFFVIGEVLLVYRIPNGLVPPSDPAGMPVDAFVAPDGRVWAFKGEGESENTYRLLESSHQRIADLTMDNLARIADGLRRIR